MNNNKCKNFKIRSKKYKRYCYCTLLKKEVPFSCYKECGYKEYKEYKKIRNRTYKQNKKEKERFSIIYQNFNKCAECGLEQGTFDTVNNTYINISKNEVFEGAYRQLSIKYGMVCPFCQKCHDRFHNDVLFNLKYKVMFQKEYLKSHSIDEFIYAFKQDYIYKSEKIKIDTQF